MSYIKIMAELYDKIEISIRNENYTFYVYDKTVADIITTSNLIYIFLKEDAPVNGHHHYNVLYVGKTTTSLATRMSNHHKWDAAIKKGFSHIAVTHVDGRSIDRIEKEFINRLNPLLNEKH